MLLCKPVEAVSRQFRRIKSHAHALRGRYGLESIDDAIESLLCG